MEEDERDTKGIRAKLNFGHTIGHALEAATEYQGYTHGEAIAIGMICASEIAERLGMVPQEITLQIQKQFERAGLPSTIEGTDVDTVFSFMRHDKKFVGVSNRFVLPNGKIGCSVLKDNIGESLIGEIIQSHILPKSKKVTLLKRQ